jgi:hypothetical protein
MRLTYVNEYYTVYQRQNYRTNAILIYNRLSLLNKLTHLKKPVGNSMGFTQIVARGG